MSYIEKEKEKIIDNLIKSKKLKPGQLIDYTYFLELYDPYKENMSEKQFAEILEITDSNYMHIKNEGTRTRVLKSKQKKVTEDKKEEIIEELLRSKKLKPGQLIDYDYFKELYKPYKDEMTEIEFAEILGITYNNYLHIKNEGTRTRVLKSKQKKVTEDKKEEIIEELLRSKKLKPGQLIDYEYFLELYAPHQDEMTEIEFAEILGITYSNHSGMKNNGTRARVLKNKQKEITKEEKASIVKKLINDKKIKPGQLINYEYFLELYGPYKNKMTEIEFAEILGITYSSYMHIKNEGTRTRVLKSKQKKVTEDKKEEIIEELLKSNKIKVGQLIDCEYFKELYKPYKDEMTEIEFAEILDITYSNFKNMKYSGEKTRILKNKQQKEITEEEKINIIEKLISDKKIKPGQLINYEYFLELYVPHQAEMTEIEFAKILGITYSNYLAMKNKGQRAKVLKDKQKKVTEDKKEEIIEELLRSKKLKPGQLIDYENFLELYAPYKDEMTESEFAEILGITYASYMHIKNEGTRARVLKNKQKEITEEEKTSIIKKLISDKKMKTGQLINYEYFLELYAPYKDRTTEIRFAEILGITYSGYKYIKNNDGARTRVLINKKEIDRIKYVLGKDWRYYSEEEIKELCNKYGCDIDIFIQYICCGGREKHISKYKELLELNGEMYVGIVPCSRNFASRYSNIMIKEANRISRILCNRYRCEHMQEDIASETLVYILEKCGDIEKNFKDNNEMVIELLSLRMATDVKHRCFRTLKRPKEIGLNRKFTYKGNQKESNAFNIGIEDKSQNIQDEVEEKILDEIKKKQEVSPEEACIELLKINVEAGLSREEALAKTGEMLGISPEEMLKSMQKYMVEKKRVRKTSSGEFVVGEGDER